MKEAEYSSLRTEIVGEQSSQVNLLIAMYTIFVAVISFAIERRNPFLFLPAIFIVILFKLQLLWKKTGISRIAAYIIVNYENEEVNWESDIVLAEKQRGKYLKRWFGIISVSSSKSATFMIGLGYVMSLFFIYHSNQALGISIVEIVAGTLGVSLALYIDIIETHRDLKQEFIDEFRAVNQKKRN